jgi:hypothetical protein
MKGFGVVMCQAICGYRVPKPYTSIHRSSNALTIILDTLPKNALDTLACNGFEKANTISNIKSVGAVWAQRSSGWLAWIPSLGDSALTGDVRGCIDDVDGCGGVSDAGWNRHVVMRVLNRGVDVAARACEGQK